MCYKPDEMVVIMSVKERDEMVKPVYHDLHVHREKQTGRPDHAQAVLQTV